MILLLLLVIADADPDLVLDCDSTALAENRLWAALEELRAHPLDLNQATLEELCRIPFLTPVGAARALRWRRLHGRFATVDEFRAVAGIRHAALPGIEQFLRVAPLPVRSRVPVASRAGVSSRVGADCWVGARLEAALDISWARARIQAQTLKDAGDRRAFDRASVGATVSLPHLVLALGDYRVGFGRGLVAGRPAAGRAALGEDDVGPGLVSAPSAAGTANLRGGGIEVSAGGMRGTGFISRRSLDCRLNPDGTVRSLVSHATSDSSVVRSGLAETAAGGRVAVTLGPLRTGVTGLAARFSRTFAPEESTCSLTGRSATAVGLDAALDADPFLVFAELAHSFPGRGAWSVLVLGDWGSLRARCECEAQQARFLAPAGGRGSLFSRRGGWSAQFGLDGENPALGWHVSSRLAGSGPGRAAAPELTAELRRGVGPVQGLLRISLHPGADDSTGHRTLLRLAWCPHRTLELRLRFEDRYQTAGRGLLGQVAASARFGALEPDIAFTWFQTDGHGVSFTVSRAGPANTWALSGAGGHLSAAATLRLGPGREVTAWAGRQVTRGEPLAFGIELRGTIR